VIPANLVITQVPYDDEETIEPKLYDSEEDEPFEPEDVVVTDDEDEGDGFPGDAEAADAAIARAAASAAAGRGIE